MMKIGVITDTHLRVPTPELYRLQHTVFADVSMILHAGDLTELEVLKAFSGKQVVAVCGNMDSRDARNILQPVEVLDLQGFRIGLTHILDNRFGMPDNPLSAFDNADAIVYGHTHRPDNEVRNGVLFFNPGAFTGGSLFARENSVGILTLTEKLSGQIIKL